MLCVYRNEMTWSCYFEPADRRQGEGEQARGPKRPRECNVINGDCPHRTSGQLAHDDDTAPPDR